MRMKARFKVCSNIDMCLERITLKQYKNHAVAVSRRQAEETRLFASRKIYCFDKAENIRNYSISLKVRKNFKCLEEVNEILRQTLEAGLIKKWSNEGQALQLHDDFDGFDDSGGVVPKLSNISLLSICFIFTLLVIAAEVVINNRIDVLNHYNFMIFVDKLFRAW